MPARYSFPHYRSRSGDNSASFLFLLAFFSDTRLDFYPGADGVASAKLKRPWAHRKLWNAGCGKEATGILLPVSRYYTHNRLPLTLETWRWPQSNLVAAGEYLVAAAVFLIGKCSTATRKVTEVHN